MANVNIFEKFGVKEVANVYFEALAPEEALEAFAKSEEAGADRKSQYAHFRAQKGI